jgi:signal peptidase I
VAVSVRDQSGPEPSRTTGRHARHRGGLPAFIRGLLEFVLIVVLALALSAFIRAFVVQAFYVPSSSMESTLEPGDRLLALKSRIGPVARGEVIVFKDPSNWLPDPIPVQGWPGQLRDALTFIGVFPSDSGKDLVKRVIGLPGDRVACCDASGRIVVNGVPLDEPYVQGKTDQVRFDIVVPPDSVFVMGDNRADSRDSRFYLDQGNGSVPLENIVGRAILVVWPFDRFGVLDIPTEFAELNAS